jgi:hypothetical protein
MKVTPVIFSEDQGFYEELAKKYKQHSKGLFILAPSGAGKTYFVDHQTEPHWIDGDILWQTSHAHPEGAWWKEPLEVIIRTDNRSDVITMEAMTQGFWIIGASNNWLKPDAIVIPDWETHKSYIKSREENNYDGGATSEDHDQVLGHIEVIKKWNTEHGVPQFSSVQEAAATLSKDIT